MQTKIRVIRSAQPTRGYDEIFGITIPKKIAIFYKDISFIVSKTDQGILLTSGTNFKDKRVVDLEDYKVN